MAEHARHGCELGGDVVQLSFELGDFSMSQLFLAETSEVMLEKEVELPTELCFVKRQTARDGISFVSVRGRLLDLRDEGDGFFLVLVALIFRLVLIKLEELLVAQVFLHDDPGRAVDCVDLGHGNAAVEKQTRDVEIWMEFGIKRLCVHRGDRGALLPADAVILARRRVGSKWDDFLTCDSLLRHETRKSI